MPCVPHPPDRVYLKHHAHHRSISHPCVGISLGSGDSSYLLMIHLDHKFSCLKKISHNTQLLVSYSVANMCWGQVWIMLWLEWVITPGNPASLSIKVYRHLFNHTCSTNNSVTNNNNGGRWTVFIRKFNFLIFWMRPFCFLQSNPSELKYLLIKLNIKYKVPLIYNLRMFLHFHSSLVLVNVHMTCRWTHTTFHIFFINCLIVFIHNFTGHLNDVSWTSNLPYHLIFCSYRVIIQIIFQINLVILNIICIMTV